MSGNRIAAAVVLFAVARVAPAGAGELVTVRVGEQETCKLTGVTSIERDKETGTDRIRFELSGLPKDTQVVRAELKLWVDAAQENVRRQWGFEVWQSVPDFDGFKVYEGAKPEPAKLLDTKFPYNIDTVWLCEFDVTRAVRAWVADPGENQGLSCSFVLPHTLKPAGRQPAWQLPYLEITHEGENRGRPPQPANLESSYRAGQVFLTWKQPKPHETAFFDQAYRVYRHTKPITAANVDQAERLGEVHRNSQLNYRRTLVSIGGDYGPWRHYAKARGLVKFGERTDRDVLRRYYEAMPKRFNFVIDDGWLEKFEGGRWVGKVPEDFANKKEDEHFARVIEGPMLADDTGLFVHTVRRPGPAYYAVTAVLEGNENRRDFTAGNALASPVEGKVEPPEPVLQALFVANDTKWPGELRQRYVCEYVYWEGSDGQFHTEPSTPLCFCFSVPTSVVGLGPAWNEDPRFPPWITSNAQLAGYSCHYWNFSGNAVRTDTRYLPPTRIAPFPPSNIGGNMALWMAEYPRFYHGSRRPPAEGEPTPQPDHNVRDVYGYMDSVGTAGDPRGATVRPFVETRQLFELDYVLRAFPLDPNFVVLDGESSCFNMAVHHPERFACVDAAQEKPWTSEAGERNAWRFSGLKAWGLKNDRGINVWQWNDPIWQSREFPDREWPFISVVHSDNYDAADNWRAMGYPGFYLDLVAEKRAGHWWWVDIGDAPDGEFMAIPRNQAVPALANATCCQTPLADWHDEPRGTLNGYIEWHRPTRPFEVKGSDSKYSLFGKPPSEAGSVSMKSEYLESDPEPRFEMALRIREEGRVQNGQSVPPCPVRCGRVDVTPRRLQAFKVVKGRKYLWQNLRVATGQLLQAGIIEPDQNGLLTAPGFFVDKDFRGNTLVIEPANGRPVPRVDQDQTVVIDYFETSGDRRQFKNMQTEELTYRDYVARCTAPEMVKVVRPGRVFQPKDFANGRRDGRAYSMWGDVKWDDTFMFPKPGQYRIEVHTTEAYFQNGAWPILTVSIDGAALPSAYIDTDGPATTVRWAEVPEGRHRLGVRSPNNTFHEPFKHGDQDPRRDRGLTLDRVLVTPLPARPGGGTKPCVVRVEPRSAVVAPGMPLRLSATVLDEWGEPAPGRVAWDVARGASIGADGAFTAAKPGEYKVLATSGDASDRAKITVAGDAWVERFDDQWPDGWRLAVGAEAASLSARWWELLLRPGDGPATAVYEPGTAWTDYRLTADFLLGREHFSPSPTRGVVFRFRDAENHYRFERTTAETDAGAPAEVCRLVRVSGGEEKELARTEEVPPPLVLSGQSWQDYPSNHTPGEGPLKPRTPEAKIERYTVEVRGPSILCKLGPKTIFNLQDPGPPQGTIGAHCAGNGSGVLVDNLGLRPLR